MFRDTPPARNKASGISQSEWLLVLDRVRKKLMARSNSE